MNILIKYNLVILFFSYIFAVSAPSFIVEIEQPNIRVVRIKSPAGSQTPMHSHNAGVTVALTDMRVEHTSLTGEVTEITRSAGDAGWREETAHSGKNLSDKPLEVILFEML